MLILIKDPGDRISFANLCGTWNVLKMVAYAMKNACFHKSFPCFLLTFHLFIFSLTFQVRKHLKF